MSKNGQKQQKKRQLRAKVVAQKMQRKTGKERVKVAAEILKLQQLGAASTNPTLEELRLESIRTREGLNGLINGFNQNAQTFAAAVANLDARIGALMLVGDDFLKLLKHESEVRLDVDGREIVTSNVDASGERKVHWEAYMKHYVDNVRQVYQAKMDLEQAAKAVQDVAAQPADVIFGGTHEDGISGQAGA